MTKKRKKLTIAFLIVCLILTGLLLFIAFYVITSTTPIYDKKNTVEHSATVSRVETSDKACTIYVLQYRCGLTIKLDEIIYDNYLSELQPDSIITFRIPDFYDEWVNEEGALYVVALQTENADIVTLESHNASTRRSMKRGKITGCVFAAVFFGGATVCAALLIKNKSKNKAAID